MTNFKSIPLKAVLFGIAFTLGGTSAFAQKKSNFEGPCADEARKFCKDVLGDKEATLECLKKLSKREISDICGNFLSQYGEPRNGTSRSRIKSKRPVGDDAKQKRSQRGRQKARAGKNTKGIVHPKNKNRKSGNKDKVKVIHPTFKDRKAGGQDKVKVIHPDYSERSAGGQDKVKIIHPDYSERSAGGQDKVKVIHPSYMDKSGKKRRTRRAKSAAKTRAPVTPPKRAAKCNRSKTCVKTNDCCPNPKRK